MLKEGMFIQERYEIIGRIGSGGMADVYKAKDHKLNRFVAVKVLKQEFREDKAFISKFRVEAQSAAGLAHPNIVNVYDVGEDHGISYIVMELVEGITLKEYIDKKGRLAVREATSIAIQVSMGLEAAHRNGIVHRDVKPQNIIISTDGKVKVTDFGIARAASSNTINSSVMGSVHYSSPEQARGGYSDYKSDIYSLGITLYEMLTGTVPFDGDSTVAIAIKHLQEELPSPRKYVPDLPKSTVQIIYKCTQKSPDRRYNDMAELIRDLKESLVNPEGDFVQLATINNNARTVVISGDELNKIKQSYGETPVSPQRNSVPNIPPVHKATAGAPGNGNPGYGGGYGNAYPPQGGRPAGQGSSYPPQRNPYQENYFDPDEDEDEDGISPKLEKFMTIGSIIIGLIILCIFLALVGNAAGLFNFKGNKTKLNQATTEVSTETETGSETESDNLQQVTEEANTPVTVPSLTGKTEKEALEALNALSIGGVKSGEQPSADYAAGQIISQTPTKGTSVEKNTTVYYVVSSGVTDVTVPEVAGLLLSDVQSACDKVGIKYNVKYTTNPNVEGNHVIYANPEAGSTVKAGDTIELWVSQPADGDTSSATTQTLKNYTGQSVIDAQSGLEAAGYVVQITEQVSADIPAGTVISQNPIDETPAAGSTVTLTVSVGAGDPAESGNGTSSGTTNTTSSEAATEAGNTTAEYSCNVSLQAPDVYAGEPVQLVITQDGRSTTLVNGEVITFPYSVKWSSESNSSGTITVYILDPGSGEVKYQYDYNNVPFK